MSVHVLDSWEAIRRQGQDLIARVTKGFTSFLQPRTNINSTYSSFSNPFDPEAIFGIGDHISACLSDVVHQLSRRLPPPNPGRTTATGTGSSSVEHDESVKEDGEGPGLGSDLMGLRQFESSQGSINITSTYYSRTHDVQTSLIARGDLWRAEASHNASPVRNENSPLFLVQLGPLLFVKDTTLLMPVHFSKQHLLWYGYDRKNGMHSLCPALWTKRRRCLLMSMIHLNPFSCSFLDLQFPSGQMTYVTGDGLTASAFIPVLGGVVQAQGKYGRDAQFSFTCKNKCGAQITPIFQWPEKSFSLELVKALSWKRSGLMLHPTLQFSICPSFGGSNPGVRAELIHSLNEKLSFICGCAYTCSPNVFASVSVGRSKWNGQVGNLGMCIRVDVPLASAGRPYFSIRFNSGVEF